MWVRADKAVRAPRVALADGPNLTPQLYEEMLPEELARIESETGARRIKSGHFTKAAEFFSEKRRSAKLEEFLTLPAYAWIGWRESKKGRFLRTGPGKLLRERLTAEFAHEEQRADS